MAKRKVKSENIIRLAQEDFIKLNELALEKLFEARQKFFNTYSEVLMDLKNPKLALEKAEQDSPISIPYNYTVITSGEEAESGEKWTEIIVSNDKEAKEIETLFETIKSE